MLHETAMQQMVTVPTRYENILDTFATNKPSLVTSCTTIPGIGDHEGILVTSQISAKLNKTPKRKVHLWKRADLNSIRSDTINFSSDLTSNHHIDTPAELLWCKIKAHMCNMLHQHVPSKMSSTRYNQPWINRKVKQCCRKKKKLYNQAKQANSTAAWAKYRQAKKSCQQICRNAYHNYISNIITDDEEDSNNHPKRLWKYIKQKRNDIFGVSPLKKENISVSDSTTKANILNDQFASVFTSDTNDPIPDKGTSPYPDMSRLHITTNGVQKLLKGLNPHKASGPDSIPCRLLKETASELAPALTLLFQASASQGTTPSDWKDALVSPVFKKGDRSTPSNYRPISLTCVCSKLLEHILSSHIRAHLENNSILTQFQHGFRKHRSCETQLILTAHDIATGLKDGKQIDAVLLDFSKAFDKVSHTRLSYKLYYYGIRGPILAWIEDFLSRRTQSVVVDGKTSKSLKVTSGVPQGTVLGPLLFLCYINDLPDRVKSSVRLFADDCLLYRTINTKEDANQLQTDLNNLQQWETDWLMSFNPSKCEVITFTKKRKPAKNKYYIRGHQLQETSAAKYLGVQLDNQLTWNQHISSITKKANSLNALLFRNLRKCPRHIKAKCFLVLVRPALEYASIVWDPHTAKHIHSLEAVQRRAARYSMNDFSKHSSVTAMLQHLKWPSLQERRTNSKLTMAYKIKNNLVAIDDNILFPPLPRSTRSSQKGGAFVPSSRLDCHLHSFFPCTARLWNNCDPITRASSTLEAFKSRLQSCVQPAP